METSFQYEFNPVKPHWIIENIVKEPSFLELSEAVKRTGMSLLDLRGDYAREMIKWYHNQCVIFNGSIEMAKLVGGQLAEQGNFPNVYTTWQNYLCTSFYSILGQYLFNDDYVIVPLSELARRKFWFYGIFAKEACIFVRPDSGDKTFKGGIVDLQDFDKFYDQFESNKHDLVIVSSPKNIRGEWRFVVTREKKIVAQSCYRYQGQSTLVPSAPPRATALVREILEVGYFPDSVFCLDIAEDNDGNFWLLEVTSFSSAGLYACNKDKIVEEVSRIALEDYACYSSKKNQTEPNGNT